ncbi:Uncharacterised protein [Providencia stuartii]|nr:Uncharacterised protein [Providencia stuartii]
MDVVSKLPMRQYTPSEAITSVIVISKLPMRQYTPSEAITSVIVISKLPMRQYTINYQEKILAQQ